MPDWNQMAAVYRHAGLSSSFGKIKRPWQVFFSSQISIFMHAGQNKTFFFVAVIESLFTSDPVFASNTLLKLLNLLPKHCIKTNIDVFLILYSHYDHVTLIKNFACWIKCYSMLYAAKRKEKFDMC